MEEHRIYRHVHNLRQPFGILHSKQMMCIESIWCWHACFVRGAPNAPESQTECKWIIVINYNVEPINCSAIIKKNSYERTPHAANRLSQAVQGLSESERGMQSINLVAHWFSDGYWLLVTPNRTLTVRVCTTMDYIVVCNLLIRPNSNGGSVSRSRTSTRCVADIENM